MGTGNFDRILFPNVPNERLTPGVYQKTSDGGAVTLPIDSSDSEKRFAVCVRAPQLYSADATTTELTCPSALEHNLCENEGTCVPSSISLGETSNLSVTGGMCRCKDFYYGQYCELKGKNVFYDTLYIIYYEFKLEVGIYSTLIYDTGVDVEKH